MRVLILLTILSPCLCFYLPGLAPTNFCEERGDGETCQTKLTIFANKLDSAKSILSYDYTSFDFCPTDPTISSSENLGQVLFGTRLHALKLEIPFGKDKPITQECKKTYSDWTPELSFLVQGIQEHYLHQWVADNLPITLCDGRDDKDGNQLCIKNFPLGCYHESESISSCLFNSEAGDVYLYNHIAISVFYNDESNGILTSGKRIVKVNLFPLSCKDPLKECKIDSAHLRLPTSETEMKKFGSLSIQYTYSVVFIKATTRWASRWDYLLGSTTRQSHIQWLSLVNSVVIAAFLSGLVAVILIRALRRDLARYNKDSTLLDDIQDEYGWKLVHGDVFRSPHNSLLLSVFVGNGLQIVLMALFTLVTACLGFLSPANRGYLIITLIVTYILLGMASGYTSARLYKTFGGVKWKMCLSVSALLLPGIVFGIIFCLNLVFWLYGSSAAIPFLTLLSLLCLWLGVSAPLNFLGGMVGFKQAEISFPVRVNKIPRAIPQQTFFSKCAFGILVGGGLPFGCIFLQMFFILNSIWGHATYYMFGFLFIVFLLLLLICCLNTILLAYFHLCSENYSWQWRAFINSSSVGLYVLGYSFYFYVTKLSIAGVTNLVLFFGYTMVFTMLVGLFTGAVGYISTLLFVRKIYSLIKID
ncbi:Transmembrane 9 superfamily member 2 [Oopsacas minuta]|uniref:Transmembrane 9 superfamily member n=1 Tax=Oopsacas minuta TaxID=111878 RepID=A0AAV7K184_9METZ|nr:Transmembrane 9 superfamily member 2 [Oopsacas minuta]